MVVLTADIKEIKSITPHSVKPCSHPRRYSVVSSDFLLLFLYHMILWINNVNPSIPLETNKKTIFKQFRLHVSHTVTQTSWLAGIDLCL